MDKKTIIAYIAIILVFLLMPYYFKLVSPKKASPPPAPKTTEQVTPDTAGTPAAPPVTAVPQVSAGPETTATAAEFPIETEPRTVTVETPVYHLEFSTRGGVLVSAVLKQYHGHNGGMVQLVRPDSEANLNLVLFQKGNPLDLKDARFVPSSYQLNVPAGGSDSLVFQAIGGNSLVQKVYRFSGPQYVIGMDVHTRDLPDLDPAYSIVWGAGMKVTETDTSQDNYYSSAYALMGGELETYSGKDSLKSVEGSTEWVAQRRKYFEVAIVPTSGKGTGANFSVEGDGIRAKYHVKYFGTGIRMNGSLNQQPGQFKVYVGPLDEKLLSQAAPNLEATMNWGWKIIEPLSKGILWLLKALHKVISNYGIVLIIFSVLIKVVLWPLTHKSTQSMARMSAIQPKMKELQEKYKGNPDKLNKAVMQLYKEEKVNPFGGCWPVLLQMPLLYALFIVFRTTIEFRGAPFVAWIRDLSMPDTIATLPFSIPMYGSHVAILPLVMGVTQILSGQAMLTDPKQKFNTYFMAIFMVLIFNGFPSGLVLYYTLFNLLTYFQQRWMRQRNAAATAVAGGR